MLTRMRVASKGRRTLKYKLLPEAEGRLEIDGDEFTFESCGAEVHVFKHRKTGEKVYSAYAPYLVVHEGDYCDDFNRYQTELWLKNPDEIRQFAKKLEEQADLLEQRQAQYSKELQEWDEAWNEST